MKAKRKLKSIIIIAFVFAFSWWVVTFLDLTKIKILEEIFLFTYLGVFLGFALTIYTFGISILENIKKPIIEADTKDIDEQKKGIFFNSIISGFNELKANIIFITYSFILVVILAILQNIQYPSSFTEVILFITHIRVVQAIYFSIFILSVVIIVDLLLSMFNLAEISLYIIKIKIKNKG
jgi:hypothetical protein